MKTLFKGTQSAERFELLFKRSGLRSKPLKNALHDFLVLGHDQSLAGLRYNVPDSNLNRGLSKLEELSSWLEEIKELDWQHLNR